MNMCGRVVSVAGCTHHTELATVAKVAAKHSAADNQSSAIAQLRDMHAQLQQKCDVKSLFARLPTI